MRGPIRRSPYVPHLVVVGLALIVAVIVLGSLKVSTDGRSACGSVFHPGDRARYSDCIDKLGNRGTILKGLGAVAAAALGAAFMLTPPKERPGAQSAT